MLKKSYRFDLAVLAEDDRIFSSSTVSFCSGRRLRGLIMRVFSMISSQ